MDWKAALWGAVFATIAWQLAARGFTWYLSSGLARYRIIYGSLGSVVILMLWIYLSAIVTLLGAHLSAVVAARGRTDGDMARGEDTRGEDTPGEDTPGEDMPA